MKSEEIITKSRQRVVQSGRLKKEKGVDHRAKVTLFSLYIWSLNYLSETIR